MTKISRLQLKAATIALLAIVLISNLALAAEKPDHTKTTNTSTVIEIQDGDTIKLANGIEVRYSQSPLFWYIP